jgi:hypothetical protein
MMRFSKRIKIILGIIAFLIVVMCATNPNLSKFISYTNSIGFNSTDPRETGNYFIFSTYQRGDYSFLGIFNQFFITRSPLD